jgi:hypothetical protein
MPGSIQRTEISAPGPRSGVKVGAASKPQLARRIGIDVANQ